jgi:hypothetical protein
MDFIDPRAAEAHEGGTLRAPLLSADEVFLRYGKTST